MIEADIKLTNDEILAAMWISQKFANEKNKSFSGILSQVLDIMEKAKEYIGEEKKKPPYCKPEFYLKKINYSWVKGPDKVSTLSLNSSEMLAVIKLAMLGSRNFNKPFTHVYDIALEMVLQEKNNFGPKESQHII